MMLYVLYSILELFRETEFIGIYVFMCMYICLSIWIIGVGSDTYGSSDVPKFVSVVIQFWVGSLGNNNCWCMNENKARWFPRSNKN